MKAKSIILKSLLILGFMTLFLSACDQKKEQKPETEEKEALTTYDNVALVSASSTCGCQSDWFPHSTTPNPADGEGSPFDVGVTGSTTNCMFQHWSVQKFLWLTRPDNGKPLFLNTLKQVTNQMAPVTIPTGATVALSSTNQAGLDGVLKTIPAYSAGGTSETVYYSIHINDTLETAIKKYGAMIQDGTLDKSNSETFPVGSLETKVSWVPTTALPSGASSDYYTTMATLDGSTTPVEVALLGMHVVGVVINHPEFIWATFEHNSLTPIFDWDSKTASSKSGTLIFAAGSVSDLNGIRWKNGAAVTADKAFGLYKYGVPITATNVYMETSQANEPKSNYNNIANLNTCVQSGLTDVWKNYQYDGAIWLNMDKLTPTQQADTLVALYRHIKDATPGSMARGSLSSANITMETFTQTYQTDPANIDASNLVNCFNCHRAAPDTGSDVIRSPLYLSHIYSGYLATLEGKTPAEIESEKLKAFMKVMTVEAKEK